jgi:hypothetical protein
MLFRMVRLAHLSFHSGARSILWFGLHTSLSSLFHPICVFLKFAASLWIWTIGTDEKLQTPHARRPQGRSIQTLFFHFLDQTQTKSFLVYSQR